MARVVMAQHFVPTSASAKQAQCYNLKPCHCRVSHWHDMIAMDHSWRCTTTPCAAGRSAELVTAAAASIPARPATKGIATMQELTARWVGHSW
jgi:hypothetical protein